MQPNLQSESDCVRSAERGTARVIHVLTGCTAVGKTELALRWAERYGAEIISCDSLLFYRGMDIGTAKPSRSELLRVPHHMIDVCDVREQMDITRYVAMARDVAEGIWKRGRAILVTGGSGFYLKAFFSPVADGIEIVPEIRAQVSGMTLEAALAKLRELNPKGLGALDVANPRRVSRALERCMASGRTLAEIADDFSKQKSPFRDWGVRLVRLERSSESLQRRIELRVGAMLDAGLVEEVRGLLEKGLRDNPSAARAIGYRETVAMIDGVLSPSDLKATIIQNTRALVKKQRTWFRTQLPVGREVNAEEANEAGLFD